MYQYLLAIAFAGIVFLVGVIGYLEHKDSVRNDIWDCVVTASADTHYAGDFQQAWDTFAPGCINK